MRNDDDDVETAASPESVSTDQLIRRAESAGLGVVRSTGSSPKPSDRARTPGAHHVSGADVVVNGNANGGAAAAKKEEDSRKKKAKTGKRSTPRTSFLNRLLRKEKAMNADGDRADGGNGLAPSTLTARETISEPPQGIESSTPMTTTTTSTTPHQSAAAAYLTNFGRRPHESISEPPVAVESSRALPTATSTTMNNGAAADRPGAYRVESTGEGQGERRRNPKEAAERLKAASNDPASDPLSSSYSRPGAHRMEGDAATNGGGDPKAAARRFKAMSADLTSADAASSRPGAQRVQGGGEGDGNGGNDPKAAARRLKEYGPADDDRRQRQQQQQQRPGAVASNGADDPKAAARRFKSGDDGGDGSANGETPLQQEPTRRETIEEPRPPPGSLPVVSTNGTVSRFSNSAPEYVPATLEASTSGDETLLSHDYTERGVVPAAEVRRAMPEVRSGNGADEPLGGHESKKAARRKRRRRFLLFVVVAVGLAALAAGLGVGLSGNGDDDGDDGGGDGTNGVDESEAPSAFPTSVPSSSPTANDCVMGAMGGYVPSPRFASIRSKLLATGVSRASDIDAPDTSQRRALCWVADADGAVRDVDNEFLVQRYVLGVLYYDWMAGDDVENAADWLTDGSECDGDWEGVSCSLGGNGAVTRPVNKLDFLEWSLEGSIPEEIGWLVELKELRLQSNRLTGDLPMSFHNLTDMTFLDLRKNLLRGGILDKIIPNMQRLEYLDIELTKPTIPVPSSIGSMDNLKHIDLSHCNIEGVIPTEMGNLAKLTFLDLSNNDLNGSVPEELNRLSKIETLLLHNNFDLDTTLPDSLCTFQSEQGFILRVDCDPASPPCSCCETTCPEDCNGITCDYI